MCILCNAVILSGLRYKQVHLRGKVNQTSVEDSYVQLGLYKTALHVCELLSVCDVRAGGHGKPSDPS